MWLVLQRQTLLAGARRLWLGRCHLPGCVLRNCQGKLQCPRRSSKMDCKQCVKRRTAATRLAPSPAEAGPRRHEHRHPVGTAVPTYSESSRRQATSPQGARRQGIHRNVLPLLCATPRPQICCLSTRHDSHHRTTFARSFFPLPVSFFHWYTCGVALIPGLLGSSVSR